MEIWGGFFFIFYFFFLLSVFAFLGAELRLNETHAWACLSIDVLIVFSTDFHLQSRFCKKS